MSYDTHKNWFYQVVGRNVELWQYVDSAATDTLDGIKIKLPDEYYGKQLIYPDESITNGLMFQGTAFIEPFILEDPNELSASDNPSTTSVATPDESSHVNMSRMLVLAIIDYIKAQLAEAAGKFEIKEYYMREFWKKVADHESNKRSFMITYPLSPFALK